MSVYEYVGGDPASFVDPEGLRPKAKKAQPGGNSHDRRQWERHGPKKIEHPEGEIKAARDNGAEIGSNYGNPSDPLNYLPDLGLVCARWTCPQVIGACAGGDDLRPTDFIPPAHNPLSNPPGCYYTPLEQKRNHHYPNRSTSWDDLADWELRRRNTRRARGLK
jgi:hypothetical protein